ncbi:twin-arginine translocation signal domain-containing protein [Mesorhizobium sp. RP14(2022)]|uniref:Twin-arginine translocation signal domain-containing protein n=1 Tax=Mesorhizobium liriopis TaxID=2953882 RepID=A0ABT1C7P6_9HYPH|nr:twin-arginine translocation signal domain-containing protein [Mesorhizobium liriopis]MCO6050846.1 twin-arginine translocation signal domain-containing protein [Mesorhizobium liriopis]
MDRRAFLRGSAVAVAAVPAVSSVPAMASGSRVISCRPEFPGYREWCILNGDHKRATVYLDGVEQKSAVAADEGAGTVTRAVRTPFGNLAVDIHKGDVLEETVHGRVEIRID